MKNESLVKEPNILTFVTTYKCTSACNNCCFQCSPKRNLTLSKEQMLDYIEQVTRDFPSVKVLVLTGGECTILKYLPEIIDVASHKYGLAVRIVSNAHWARTYDSARKKVAELKAAGLNEINFSTGDEHLEFVPIEYIKNAIIASVEEGFVPYVNVESIESHDFNSTYFTKDEELSTLLDENKFKVSNGIWIDLKNPEAMMKKPDKGIHCSNQRCDNIFSGLVITPDNRLKACCGITSGRVKYLDLGNPAKIPLHTLYDKQFDDFVKIWLHTDGALKILEFIAKYDKRIKIEEFEHLHQCLICTMILNSEKLLGIIKEHYDEVYANIIMKYNLI